MDIHIREANSYKEYLNSFLTATDLRYFGNRRYCRMLVKFGYHTANEILSEPAFEQKKNEKRDLYLQKKKLTFFSEGIKITDPVLQELANREKANHQKVISTILFVRHYTKRGFEKSGYIDFEQSLRKSLLRTEDSLNWKAIFAGKKKITPMPTDLSYRNWRTNVIKSNDSDNFKTIAHPKYGLTFVHKIDRKLLSPGTLSKFCSFLERSMVYSEKHGLVIFYDHLIRRKM